MWFNLAASRIIGVLGSTAAQGRDIVAGQMNPTQIAEAERLAREWDAAHPGGWRDYDIFAAKMTAEQVAEAQRLSRAWNAAHPRVRL
jgi:hypothetical protein